VRRPKRDGRTTRYYSPLSDVDMDPIAEAIATGEQSISGLVDHAVELGGLIQKSFPAVPLQAVHDKFAALPKPAAGEGKPPVNKEVVALCNLVRDQAAIATQEFLNAEMWISMKAPSCSDGNNFGVDVQNFVTTELKAMRTKIQAMLDVVSTYHWQRGLGLEKLASPKTSDVSESENNEVDGEGKKTSKKTTTTTSKTTADKSIGDFEQYYVAFDVKQYHAAYVQLSELKNFYVTAHALFSKNMKRLADPRGEGESGSATNVMSMF